jgi:hypothetical protein
MDAECAARDAANTRACASGLCVECTRSEHCSVDVLKPICVANRCAPCTSDDQCLNKMGFAAPGVCLLHQGGRCAADAETYYVENKAGCVTSGASGGTLATPFCHPQPAVDAAVPQAVRRLVVLRGTAAFANVSVNNANPQGAPLAIIARASTPPVGPIAGGPNVGLRVVLGEVYVRGVTVKGSANVGVVVESGSTLRMTRSIVESNARGGIHVNGGGFDITNTVVAGNGPGDIGGLPWGGVHIIPPPAGRPARFAHATVYRNSGGGLTCAGPVSAPGLLAYGTQSAPSDIGSTCMVAACCGAGDPLLTTTYHLMPGSPCIDKAAAMTVPDDIDGDSRSDPAAGAAGDCGADEYRR